MSALANLKTITRLALGFGLLGVLFVGVAAYALWGITNINQVMDAAVEEYRQTELALLADGHVHEAFLNIANILLHTEQAEKAGHQEDANQARQDYMAYLDELKKSDQTEKGQELIANLEAAIAASREVNIQATELSLQGEENQARDVFNEQSMSSLAVIDQAQAALLAYRQERVLEMDIQAENMASMLRTLLISAVVVGLALAAALSYFITRSVTLPLKQASAHLMDVAQGDLRCQVSSGLLERKDEMGDMGRALAKLLESMKVSMIAVQQSAQALASASTELTSISEEVTAGASESAGSADQAAAAAQEMSADTVSVAAGMEQAMGSLNSVATATEEMTATIGEIADNSEKARSTTLEAARQADRITAAMKELGRSAQEIGKVTETITSISAQTNLLALNATIEAARAGAAGKGFAVVANEIKELAQQTAAATGEIKGQIASVQSSTAGAAADIEQIVGVIKEVSEIVTSIATAIEEQSVVTRDIAGNIAQASLGVKDANRRVAQTADVSRSIADGVSGVSQTSNEMAAASQQVQASAQELSRLAEQMRGMLSHYRI